ncbi:MAG: DUF262 domain-containing protein [Clostridia bacterium]|nr:DUF262 domain-containing protein [Clostridia bacterium]
MEETNINAPAENLEQLLNINTQLAENIEVEEESISPTSSEEKRKLLEKTKIVKQTWSILEIYQKVKDKKLILDPYYQRNIVWKADKKVAFIESLYMGIIIPPIYVVECPGENILEGTTYEVVDGKQRLTTILEFIKNEFTLTEKSLEYFKDCFSNKKFAQIQEEYPEETNEMLSSVLDIYVITANSPEFTKYDIFSRLNKGSEPLKVNEIRKAVYQSHALKIVDGYVHDHQKSEFYKLVFSENDIKRYEDFGRFFRSIAFYLKADEEHNVIIGYNSRPREMINDVLASLQKNKSLLGDEIIKKILDTTIQLCLRFKENSNMLHLVDACIYWAVKYEEKFNLIADTIANDSIILQTLERSAPTTSNVNLRFKRIRELIGGATNDNQQ